MEGDKSNLKSVILNSVKQLSSEPDFFNQLCLTRRSFNKIILCGMGGSALVGDFFDYLKEQKHIPLSLPIPLTTHRSYALPPEADHHSLIICISYSGDTEETISAYNEAKKQNLEVAAITYGGKLADLCKQNNTPWIKIPQDKMPPRFSLGYQLIALTKIFMAYGLLASSAKDEAVLLAENIDPSLVENDARIICTKLAHKVPVIYSSKDNELLAKLWKIQFNENAKVPAFYNSFPELNHNEMVGWTRSLGPFSFLFLQDENDSPEIKKRMQLTTKLLQAKNLPVEFVKVSGLTPLEKLFRSLVFGDWLSYHLALFYGVDPTPVEMVEEFKKLLKN